MPDPSPPRPLRRLKFWARSDRLFRSKPDPVRQAKPKNRGHQRMLLDRTVRSKRSPLTSPVVLALAAWLRASATVVELGFAGIALEAGHSAERKRRRDCPLLESRFPRARHCCPSSRTRRRKASSPQKTRTMRVRNVGLSCTQRTVSDATTVSSRVDTIPYPGVVKTNSKPTMSVQGDLVVSRPTSNHLRGVDDGLYLITLETNEYADDSNVGNAELVIYRIELAVESHSILTIRTSRPSVVMDCAGRCPPKLMPLANIVSRPFESWKVSSLFSYGFRN